MLYYRIYRSKVSSIALRNKYLCQHSQYNKSQLIRASLALFVDRPTTSPTHKHSKQYHCRFCVNVGHRWNQHFRIPCIVAALPFDIQYLKPMTALPHDIFILVVIIIGCCRLFPSPSPWSRPAPPSSLLTQNSNKRRRSSIDDGRSRTGEIIPTCHLPPPAVEIVSNIPHSRQHALKS